MLFLSPKKLKSYGILGMNRRNVSYIANYNPRNHYPRADDKLRTKAILEKAGISTPTLIGTVRHQFQIKGMLETLCARNGFVIKPANGSAGKGILVIERTHNGAFLKPNGKPLGAQDIKRHLSNILSGLYSLGGKPDAAMVEEFVQFSDTFEGYTYEGVPDIRTIVFKGFPVMAMTRLSTGQSDGRANLHQGAVGLGLNISTGNVLNAVLHGKPIDKHPDTGKNFAALSIPYWRQLLLLSSSCYEVTELGYLGVDVVIDENLGPLILELNVRPGLSIQIANGIGIEPRLRLIENMGDSSKMDVHERVAFAMENFG